MSNLAFNTTNNSTNIQGLVNQVPSEFIEDNDSELFKSALTSIEQGVWTVISYFAEMNSKDAVTLAKKMDCSINSIHELDWERFDEVFGSRGKFLRKYSKTTAAVKAKLTAFALVDIYLAKSPSHDRQNFSSTDLGRIYRVGVVVGASAALGEVNIINSEAANIISSIVSAPIAFDGSQLITNMFTF